MQIQGQSFFLRSHLLKMVMLSQKAVDYSIKAYQLGASEINALFWKNDFQWRVLQRSIGDRGRKLAASGTPIDYDSHIAGCALRIYGALHVTYMAACAIAHISARGAAHDRTNPVQDLEESARFVNSLVALWTLALFKSEAQYTRSILLDHRAWRWFELKLCRTRHSLMQNVGAEARGQLALARALGQIAEQAREIAQACSVCCEKDNCLGSAREEPSIAA
jgi:hypothetical protein